MLTLSFYLKPPKKTLICFPHQNGTYYGYDCESPVWKKPIHNCQSQYQKLLTVVDSFGNYYIILKLLIYMYTSWYKNIIGM